MLMFFLGLLALYFGYALYGRFVEKILQPDDRTTPARLFADGVDYVVLPHWKNMLIQLLNIAGVGPVIGVILGVKFGPIVFLIIPFGNIIGGAVHDFVAGMMSLRHKGANHPALIRMATNTPVYVAFSVFMCFLLLLVVAVFINVPAALISGMVPSSAAITVFGVPFTPVLLLSILLIFLYYIASTIFPIDKIIGKIYPVFGLMLLIGTAAIMVSLVWHESFITPNLLKTNPESLPLFQSFQEKNPILPCLFVTIACGILSGFHATQSPIIARTMISEKQARSSFYGMMVVEGAIALVWAAAGYAIYNLMPEQINANPNHVLLVITKHFLGSWMGSLTVIAVIILAITSGDTAMRSLRLSLAEIFHLDQRRAHSRILLCLPIIGIVIALLFWSNIDKKSFGLLWNYFAWGNQVLASFTLLSCSVWLFSLRRNGFVTLIPGIFITFIVATFILWTSPEHGGPYGFGLELPLAQTIGLALALLLGFWAWRSGNHRIGDIPDDPEYTANAESQK